MKPKSDGVVYLNEFTLSDAPALLAADRDEEHRRRFDFPDDFVPSIEHSRSVILAWIEDRRAGVCRAYAVRESNSSEIVGGCEIRPGDDETANLSYWTHPVHRRRGIATRAVSIACRIAAELGITHLEILVDKDNTASRRVAINNSFQESGIRDGRLCYFCNPMERIDEINE